VRIGEEKRIGRQKNKEEEETTAAKYNGLLNFIGRSY